MPWTKTIKQLAPEAETWEPPSQLCHVAERMSRVSLMPAATHYDLAIDAQESLDAAREALETELLSLRCALADAKRAMRDVEREYVQKHDKPTVAERMYKSDERHAHLEYLATRCEAHIQYAEGLQRMVEDKTYKLGTILKGHSNNV